MNDPAAIVDDAAFTAMVDARARSLLDVAGRLGAVDADAALALLTRPMLAMIRSEATQLEELLDAYGALRNERWRHFRGVMAGVKTFAHAHYGLVHLLHASAQYRLLCEEADLDAGLLQARRFTAQVLHAASRRLAEAARSLGLSPRPADVCAEVLPPGRLPPDCPLRHVEDAGETVARLATAFLNLADGGARSLAPRAASAGGDPSQDALPTEGELRDAAEDFHNLQALYDTHVARTDVERDDPELLSLRGHASAVYHLLEVATELVHYRERHLVHAPAGGDRLPLFGDHPGGIPPARLDAVLRVVLVLVTRYLQVGRTLAQQLLRRYAERGEITVPVPRYRGFHVRPSTLVARVAYHYGSAVSMTLDGETYDAASPMELFRANEAINARKRRWLAQEIGALVNGDEERLGDDLVRAVRNVLVRLSEEAKVILYEQPLPPIEGPLGGGQPVLAFIVDAVARLQALGKIDIVATVTATFRGDRRVLADLELLAESGYGEDAYGNNIALPEQLGYLRR
ncbi:HPr family phosphocarrier protein [Anaeromyxobacter diazotrophicus]|uniref:Uncharacterized protein n=1 Tax=Anaeromyxobacter diazotrophicus TaxID=2590199 RepID=A0A7I9VJG5_9BACT|nr:HPr family phosphocarrier protein [Anaeromyxobacter diazotrophicus]GEJ56554.1 hypothetical protein AMYX_12950 [Anaeromyxobacter diazotrophicus]